jgi:hypothetical protein
LYPEPFFASGLHRGVGCQVHEQRSTVYFDLTRDDDHDWVALSDGGSWRMDASIQSTVSEIREVPAPPSISA